MTMKKKKNQNHTGNPKAYAEPRPEDRLDLNEENVQAVLDRCFAENGAEGNGLITVRLTTNDKVVNPLGNFRFERRIVRENAAAMLYLLGQTALAHEAEGKPYAELRMGDLEQLGRKYDGTVWTKDNTKLMWAYCLGNLSGAFHPFEPHLLAGPDDFDSYTMMYHLRPTFSPDDERKRS